MTGTNNTWILRGKRDLQSINGKLDNFDIDITMISKNGTMRYHMVLTNFTQLENNR